MAQKYPFSVWNYNIRGDFEPTEVDVWAECGLTVTMTERTFYGEHDITTLVPFLDRANEKGIKLIFNIVGLTNDDYVKIGEEEYERRFAEVYEIVKGHPALYGFYVGDEPTTKEMIDASVACLRIQKRIAPELRPYINIQGASPFFETEVFSGKTFKEWLYDVAAETGFSNFSFSQYEQMNDDAGIDFYFDSIKNLVEAADPANVDVWGCLLLSAHYHFRVPSEYDIMWQITTSAACGCRGMNWFRFYDRAHGPNYHGSPVDEYGYKTEQYYKLLRCQRRFNDHYGELLMSLKRQSTYFMGKQRADYPMFGADTHDYVEMIKAEREAIVSLYKAEDGTEYMVLVNADQKKDGVFKIYFDREKCNLVEVLFNGTKDLPYHYGNTKDHWDGQWLYPGQMCIYRIDKK